MGITLLKPETRLFKELSVGDYFLMDGGKTIIYRISYISAQVTKMYIVETNTGDIYSKDIETYRWANVDVIPVEIVSIDAVCKRI